MSNFFKSKGKVISLLMACILVVTGVAAFVAKGLLNDDLKPLDNPDEQTETVEVPLVENVEKVEAISFNSPDVMRGAFITPGAEVLTSPEDNADTVARQTAEVLKAAKEYTLNTIIINPKYNDQVIYKTKDSNSVELGEDIFAQIVEAVKAEGFYVYSVFDLSDYKNGTGSSALAVGSGEFNALTENLTEFAEKYELDGILLDGYQNETRADSYGIYAKLGAAIGFENYMRQNPEVVLRSASTVVKKVSTEIQVGLLADSVWANAEENSEGSNTTAEYTALTSANADTKAYTEKKLVDFVVVKALKPTSNEEEPFGEVVNWWGGIAQNANVPLYVMQASSALGTDSSWNANQLVEQAMLIDSASGVRGNVFDSLVKLIDNPNDSTTTLMKYYKEEVEPELIMTELKVTKPSKTIVTTSETKVAFTGASDPAEPVMINDEQITTGQSGYFTAYFDLTAGVNHFKISHKDKSMDYKITREVDILTEIIPAGNIKTNGGAEVTLSAIAYDGATVSAMVGGQTVELIADDAIVNEAVRGSSYKQYTGVYTAPEATASVQNIGTVSITASWEGETKTLQGATISVNPQAKAEGGTPIIVTADQAVTYPASALDDLPNSSYYPLPKGAVDYAIGETVEYKGVEYTTLASGLRIKSDDTASHSDGASGNVISGLSISSENGYTYITIKTAKQVTYSFKYNVDSVAIEFSNTIEVPTSAELKQNALFSTATWSDKSTLNLKLVKQGGFMGYKGYYDTDGNLVLKFNNTLSSLSGARIVIDTGHDGSDVGAIGFLADYPEYAINNAIGKEVVAMLEEKGAEVLLLDTADGMEPETRAAKAEEFEADMLISIHNNTALNDKAKGTEVFFFNPYSKALAVGGASAVSSQLGTENRGAKQSYYTETISTQFPSVLVECGFISNRTEYEKLIRTKYHEKIAVGIVDGISSAINATSTGNTGGTTETSGTATPKPPVVPVKTPVKPSEPAVKPSEPAVKPSEPVTPTPKPAVTPKPATTPKPTATAAGVSLSRTTLSLKVGATSQLTATVTPKEAEQEVNWSSGNRNIAKVDGNGKVTAVKKGTVTITATAQSGKVVSCKITVVEGLPTEPATTSGVPVEDVVLSKDTFAIGIKATYQLDVGIYPDDAGNKAVTWGSNSTEIATVDSKGLVTGIGKGTATITVTSVDGKKTATASVVVTDDANTGPSAGTSGAGSEALKGAQYIELFNLSTPMYLNTTQNAQVRTDKGTTVANTVLKWESSDKSIFTVDANGVITAKKKEGTAAVVVYNSDETLYDSYNITVTKTKVMVTGVSLNLYELSVPVGKTNASLKATLTPSDATTKGITWVVANTNIAKVNESGVVTGVATGTTTLIAKSQDGGKRAECKVTVTDGAKITEISLEEGFEMNVGDTDYLAATIEPVGVEVQLEWKSSSPSVLEVDKDGNITAKRAGTATITVSVPGSGVSASSRIKVVG